MKVLFVSSSSLQSHNWVLVSQSLESHGIVSMAMPLDPYTQSDSKSVLIEHGVKCIDLNVPALVRRRGKWLRYLHALRYLRRSVEEILMVERPCLVVVGNDRLLLERIAVRRAGSMGIPSLLVQDGFIYEQERPVTRRKAMSASVRAITERAVRRLLTALGNPADYVQYGCGECALRAVAGPYTKELLVARGVDASKIVVTGIPRFDEISTKRLAARAIRRSVRTKLAVDANMNVILWVAQPFLHDRLISHREHVELLEGILQSVADSLTSESGELWIKLHPRDERRLYNDVLRKAADRKRLGYGLRILQAGDVDIHAAIIGADLVVGINSTSLLEAACLGRPAVLIDILPSMKVPRAFVEGGVGLIAQSWLQLARIVNDMMREHTARVESPTDGLYRELSSLALADGHAADRVAAVIKSLGGSSGER